MNTCKTCIHWRDVTNGARPVRLDDVTVKCCTALPPVGDYRWPRTMEHQVCGMHDAPPQVADLIDQVPMAAPGNAARRTRRSAS